MKNKLCSALAVLILIPGTGLGQSFDWVDRVGMIDPACTQPSAMLDVSASDEGIYSLGLIRCGQSQRGLLLKHKADGTLVWQRVFVVNSQTTPRSIAADANGVFIVGTSSSGSPSNSFVIRYSHAGDRDWTRVSANPDNSGLSIVTDFNGVYVFGYNSGGTVGVLRRFNFAGELQWTRLLDAGLPPLDLAMGNGRLYAAALDESAGGVVFVYSTDGSRIDRFALSGGDAPDYLVYFDQHLYMSGGSKVSKYSVRGNAVWTFNFEIGTQYDEFDQIRGLVAGENGVFVNARYRDPRPFISPPISSVREGMALINIALDGQIEDVIEFPAQPMRTSALSMVDGVIYSVGTQTRVVNPQAAFTARYSGADLLPPSVVVLERGGAEEAPELAVLQHYNGAGPVLAGVRAVAPASEHRMVAFAEDLKPIEFFALPDMNGNGHGELLVVSRRGKLAEIRDSMLGTLINTLPGETNFEQIAAAVGLSVGSGNNAVLAVLARQTVKGWLRLRLYDLATGAVLATFPYNPNFEPVDVEVLPDTNGDGEPEYAVLARNPVAGLAHKIEIRSRSGELVGNIWLGSAMAPVEFQLVEDSGGAKLAVLNYDDGLDWMDVAFIELSTMQVSSRLPFNGTFAPHALIVATDADGNGAPQVGVYGAGTKNYHVKLESRDALTQALDYNAFQWRYFRPNDAVYVGRIPGLNERAIGLLSQFEQRERGDLHVHLVDARFGGEVLHLRFLTSIP